MKGLDEVLRDVDGDLVEAWHKFQPDLVFEREFATNEYKKAEKAIHLDYGNLIIMSVKLQNGYILVEHSICMDPEKSDVNKGIEICKEKILSKLLEIYRPVEIKDPKKLKKFSIKAK
ncbi:Gp49 family protein [Anaerosalibacter massiliensis]|uniref:Gp49 family protein n=1 Tax=Anaerosalibacter massiliensis TaxID=1347392 RepID=A0A9X2MHE7_9FIRM|nr:Gp49 family protein [Anaerosalibacter massiliensis]